MPNNRRERWELTWGQKRWREEERERGERWKRKTVFLGAKQWVLEWGRGVVKDGRLRTRRLN